MTVKLQAKGCFITFEGGEGTGKTTQIKQLANSLKAEGYDVVTTREPGGTPEAEKIRDILVKRDGGNWTPAAECLLFFAARSMHVETLIKPALAAGKIVISDRFADSTRAYQSAGRGLPPEAIEKIYEVTLGNFSPDLTFIMDIHPTEGLKRANRRLENDQSTEDRFENLDMAFHERLRARFLDIAQKEPGRCRVVNAADPIDKLAEKILSEVKRKVGHV